MKARLVAAPGAPARVSVRRDEAEFVTLVDARDRVTGSCGKLDAHRSGRLHRAFSIVILNQQDELLLQRRAGHKYHFGGYWSNACCGHPRPGESKSAAARRRLNEELGIDVALEKRTELRYRASDPVSGLIEHEYLHVYSGSFSGEPRPDPDEVDAWRWMSGARIRRAMDRHPDSFTPWFRLLIERISWPH
ncbi:MAG: isopentenyl-diphosphate Delta-isomerase [Chromatiaceae bacterium]|nr:isopentenyl-diphosphate Delta-isomerase [Chromatiaceae bacterium]